MTSTWTLGSSRVDFCEGRCLDSCISAHSLRSAMAYIDRMINLWVAGETVMMVGAVIGVGVWLAECARALAMASVRAQGIRRLVRRFVPTWSVVLTALLGIALLLFGNLWTIVQALFTTPPHPATPPPPNLSTCTPILGLASDSLKSIREELHPISKSVSAIADLNDIFESSTTKLWILHVALDESESRLEQWTAKVIYGDRAG